MKELSIEEKAKAYDKALERAKKWHDAPNSSTIPTFANRITEEIFPELAESEDERIRNLIYCLIRDRDDNGKLLKANGCSVEEALAWLEKQNHNGKKWIYEDVYLKEKEQLYQDGVDDVLENPQKYGLEKQGEQKSIMNVPAREVILSIWGLGNEWKELTNGSISTVYGTQLDYIQNHWQESEYYLRAKQGEQKPADKVEPKFNEGEWITIKE